MRDTLRRSPDVRILMELWPYVLDRYTPGTRAVIGLLESWGFEMRRLLAHHRLGERLTAGGIIPGTGDVGVWFDVLCTRRS
jgi:hypothetical protein